MEKAFIFGKREDDFEEFVSLDEVSAVRPLPSGGYTVSLRFPGHTYFVEGFSGHTYFVKDFRRYSVQEIEEWSRRKFLESGRGF